MEIDFTHELSELIISLNRSDLEYAVCGGVAVAIHGHIRATTDIDHLAQEKSLPDIKATLKTIGFTLDGGIMPFDPGKPTERHFARVSKVIGEEILTVDLILVSNDLSDVWAGREKIEFGDQIMQVVSLEGLKKMKRLSGRPLDLQDIAALEQLHGE